MSVKSFWGSSFYFPRFFFSLKPFPNEDEHLKTVCNFFLFYAVGINKKKIIFWWGIEFICGLKRWYFCLKGSNRNDIMWNEAIHNNDLQVNSNNRLKNFQSVRPQNCLWSFDRYRWGPGLPSSSCETLSRFLSITSSYYSMIS